MNQLPKILPIVLIYQEKGWTEKTVQCLLDAGFKREDIVFADRDGVGNMARAFNSALNLIKSTDELEYLRFRGEFIEDKRMYNVKYIWFLTNVTFAPEMPLSLLSAFDDDTAAVHPIFDSEHLHMRRAFGVNPDAQFIEWTAPMVRADVFFELGGLDEKMPYWGFDLHFSQQAKARGYSLKVDGRYKLEHTYLNHNAPEKISLIRKELRTLYDKSTEDRLIELYGDDYLKLIWANHPYVPQGRKRIYQ